MNIKKIKHIEWIFLSAIVVVGVLLRIIAQAQLLVISPDGVQYIYHASRIKEGIGSFERRGPLFQLLLILIYKISGVNLQSSIFLPLFFGSINPIIFFFVGKYLFDSKTGLLAALLSSISTLSINLSCYVLRETFSLFLILIFILTVNYSLKIKTKKKSFIATILPAFLCGLIILNREEMIFVVPFSYITYIYFMDNRHKDFLTRTLIFLIINFITITPWLIYSNITFDNPFFSYFYYMQGFVTYFSSPLISQPVTERGSILNIAIRGIFGIWTEIYAIPHILSLIGLVFLAIGIMYTLKRRDIWIIYFLMIYDIITLSFFFGRAETVARWGGPHIWWDQNRIPYSAIFPAIVISAYGIRKFAIFPINSGQKKVILSSLNRTKGKSSVLMISALLILGMIEYIPAYSLQLKNLNERSSFPFIESAEFLNSLGSGNGVFTMHPEMLAKYYNGTIYKLPEKGSFEDILKEATSKRVRYLIIESTCISSKELLDLYYQSVNPMWRRAPQEFLLLKAVKWKYGVYYIQTQTSLNAAIFTNSKWDHYNPLIKILTWMEASTRIFDETSSLLDIDLSELDLLVFFDYISPLSDKERSYLEGSIEKGLKVIVFGISPPYLAGGIKDLNSISNWFGATVFSEAPKDERWLVKFTDSAIDINELDLGHEYAFYTNSDWSTPTGCVVQPEAVIYAYRANDGAGTIFSKKFGEGMSIFIGPRYGFDSPDKDTFETFLRSLIRFIIEETS